MTARLREWQSRFQVCLAERRARPFSWGSQDCVLFAADCVEACTGEDPARHVRGQYDGERGAAALLRIYGGLPELAAGCLGEEVAPLLAQPGDIGLIANEGRPSLAACIGARWIAPGKEGLVTVSMKQALRAWRLPSKD